MPPMIHWSPDCTGVAVAAIVGSIFGAIFYSNALFLPLWSKYSNRPRAKGNKMPIMIANFLCNVFCAAILTKLIGIPASFAAAVTRGAITGAGIGGTTLAHNYLFSNVDVAVFFVDIMHTIMKHALMAGAIYMCHPPPPTTLGTIFGK